MIRLNGAHPALLPAADFETMDVGVQLLTACERGELHVVRKLVESRAVDPRKVTERHYRYLPNVGNAGGYTPLHYACL